MADREAEAALFIDHENIYTSVRKHLNANVDWQLLLKSLERFGRLAIRRAYSDWSRNADHVQALVRLAIEPINAVSLHKNVSDMVMAVDAMETLVDRPEIETYIIVSGDSDFTILAQRLRQHQKEVVGVGVRDATASVLVEVCDEFVFYNDLIADNARAPLASSNDRLGRLRLQLLQQLQSDIQPGRWVNSAALIAGLRRRNPKFDIEMAMEGFARFRDFLDSFPTLVEARIAPGKGHLEARLRDQTAPHIEHTESAYLNAIRKERLYMTPHPYRANVIIRAYKVMEEEAPPTLTALKQRLIALIQSDPSMDDRLVNEVMYQLFHAYSFDFDKRPDRQLWDCPFRLKPFIKSGQDLLRNTDIDIIKRIMRGLGVVELDPRIVARVLYGRDDHPALVGRVTGFLQELGSSLQPRG